MFCYRVDDENPDGKITFARWDDAVDYIRDTIECMAFHPSANDKLTITVEVVEMTQEEFDALPEY